MPIYQKEEINPLHFMLSIQLEPADYEADYETELNKYRKQASLKGFRKGKTPSSVLRKMFGKSILADVLNKQLQEAITQYFREQSLNMLGNPIPSEDNDYINLDARHLHQYAFKFEVGIAPKVDILGAGPESTYERYAIEVTDDMVSDHLAQLLDRLADFEQPEADFLDSDSIQWQAVELQDDNPKLEGEDLSFEATIAQLQDENLRSQVRTAKVGDTFRVQIRNAFEVPTETLLHWLKTNETDFSSINDWFDITIESVHRKKAAELGQDFYDKAFGPGKVSNEDEARQMIRDSFLNAYLPSANSLVFVEIRDRIMRETKFELPETFLKKWMAYSNDDMTPEKIEEGFDKFLEALRWSIIRNQLAAEYQIQVTDEEIEAHFIQNIRNYFGNSPFVDHNFLQNMANRLMEDEQQVNQVYEELFTEKLFLDILQKINITPIPISKEDFEREIKKSRERLNPESEMEIPELTAEVEAVSSETQETDD